MHKVFGIGLNKTGTTTLGVCLSQLGYRHTSFQRALLVDFVAGNPEPAFAVADQFDSFEDWPWPLMYRELDARFPRSKFILTLRASPEIWLESLKQHSTTTHPDMHARKLAYGWDYPHGHEQEHLAFYRRHAEAVRAHFGSRLLELTWEDGDGWEKLCGFLDKPVPDVPLPHANRASDYNINPAFQAENLRRIAQQVASLSSAPRDT